VQVQRMHLHKRKTLAALYAIHLYLHVVEDGHVLEHPHACLFAGKVVPEYFLAKLVIRLLCSLSRAEEILALRASGGHDPQRTIAASPALARVIDALCGGRIANDGAEIFAPLLRYLFEERAP
jgi:hypothetical protein